MIDRSVRDSYSCQGCFRIESCKKHRQDVYTLWNMNCCNKNNIEEALTSETEHTIRCLERHANKERLFKNRDEFLKLYKDVEFWEAHTFEPLGEFLRDEEQNKKRRVIHD